MDTDQNGKLWFQAERMDTDRKRSLHSELTEVVSELIDAYWRLHEIGEDHRIATAWTPQDAELYRERTTLESELKRALDHVSEQTKHAACRFTPEGGSRWTRLLPEN